MTVTIILGLVILLWFRSYLQADILTTAAYKDTSMRVISCSGIVMFETIAYPGITSTFGYKTRHAGALEADYEMWALTMASFTNQRVVGTEDYGFYAFRTKRRSFVAQGTTFELFSINLPYWLFTLIFALVPGKVIAYGLLRWQRVAHRHCQHCSYNLTGNVSGTCPECGGSLSPHQNQKG